MYFDQSYVQQFISIRCTAVTEYLQHGGAFTIVEKVSSPVIPCTDKNSCCTSEIRAQLCWMGKF